MNFNETKVGTTKTEEIQYTDVTVATNQFNIEGGTARIICWGDSYESTVEMDSDSFEAEELTAELIYDNLNDGQFGCQRIVGATDVCVTQVYQVNRTFADGRTIEFETDEVVAELDIEKQADGKIVCESIC